MANASDLSLRGAKRRGNLGKALTLIAHAIVGERTAGPGGALTVRTSHRQNGKRFRFVIARSEATWQSREGTHADRTRHCRGADSRARRRTYSPYKPPSKWQTLPICHCEEANGRRGALSAKREEVPLGCNLGKAVTLIAHAIVGERTAGPGGALTVRTSHRQNGKRFRFVIARPRRGRGNLGKAVTISPIVFLGSGSVLRDCHVASLLAMTRQGSAVVHQRSPAVELLPTGRSLSAATVKFGSDRVRRHSVYIGSAFPRLPRARSALAMTNLRTLHR